jgi:hypothetical protein
LYELALLWSGAGMYLRTTARRNKDGTSVRYLALAHHRRVDGSTQAQVLLNLGREDRLDPAGLRRLVRSINRYLGEPDPTAGTDAAAAVGLDDPDTGGLRLTASARPARPGCSTGCGRPSAWRPRCGGCSAGDGAPPT